LELTPDRIGSYPMRGTTLRRTKGLKIGTTKMA
jgi:hypothetical protein